MTVTALVLLFVLPASARELSLEQALDLGAGGNPSIATAALRTDQAEAAVERARSAWDPALVASASRSTAGGEENAASGSVGLQVAAPTGTTVAVTTGVGHTTVDPALPTTWEGSADLTLGQDLLAPLRASDGRIAARTAGERLDQAEIGELQAAEDGLVQIAEAWWTWWSAVDAARVAERSLELATALEDRTRAQRDVGQIAQLELDRVTTDRLGAAQERLRAEADARRSADALLVLIGLDPGQAVEPAGDGRVGHAEPLALEEALAAAEAGNRDLALARLEVDAAASAVRDARDGGLPTVDLTVAAGISAWDAQAVDAVSGLADGELHTTVGLDVVVPLGGRAARAGRADARAGVDIERIALAATERQVAADVRAAVDGLRTADEGVSLATARLDVARSTEAGEQARVDEGVRRLDELLKATEDREAAEAGLRTATVDLARADLTLLRLIGQVGGPRGR